MNVLIIGSGGNVEFELETINRADFDKVIAVNRAARLFGPVDYHVSLHPERFAARKQAHFVAPRQDRYRLVDEVFSWKWPEFEGNSGSSGLYAVKYALERLDAHSVVLAGVGMDIAPHVYNSRDWKAAADHRITWTKVAKRIAPKVTSLGGWTKELLERHK